MFLIFNNLFRKNIMVMSRKKSLLFTFLLISMQSIVINSMITEKTERDFLQGLEDDYQAFNADVVSTTATRKLNNRRHEIDQYAKTLSKSQRAELYKHVQVIDKKYRKVYERVTAK